MQASLKTLPQLFCKPELGENNSGDLFSKFSMELDGYISFRSFDLERDIDLIYDWVNQPYALAFWQMNGDKKLLIQTYSVILSNPHAHSFIGLLDGQPICQIDVYRVLADELSNHISVTPEDCGMHLLMAPNQNAVKGLTKSVVAAFLKFYFSFSMANCMYGEPDTKNNKATRLLECLGFEYLKEVTLSYKTASLYSLRRENFNSIIF